MVQMKDSGVELKFCRIVLFLLASRVGFGFMDEHRLRFLFVNMFGLQVVHSGG